MPQHLRESRFTDKDLEFLIEAGSPGVSDRMRLKQILREDEDFRDALIGDGKIFRRLMHDADISLFILGIFPDFVESKYRYPLSGNIRPQFGKNYRISPQEYQKTGRKFYKMAAEHHTAEKIALSDVFWDLHHNFQSAKKPLNFISDHYLRYKRDALFA
jgi:hypothetical protein